MRFLASQIRRPNHFICCGALLLLVAVAGSASAIDHSLFINEFNGAQTCETCHPGTVAAIQQTVHYKFESAVPENYLYDEEGNLREIDRSGKLWKLCGFPTTFAQLNWLGKLKDLPETDHIDSPGGCGKCHIGIGTKPYTAVGATEPQASEQYNVDCLVCHAENYTRKFYVATVGGEPELMSNGKPVVMAVPKVDGVLDFSVQLEAAQSVGRPKTEYCARCHTAAGGGRVIQDNHQYSFKRGSTYDAETDVHAAAGLSCVDCHSAGNHQTRRSPNNDIYAYDNLVDHQLCVDCHTDAPHTEQPMYNMHSSFASCTTCHATSKGGVVYKDFADIVAPDPSNPLGLYEARLDFAGDDFKLEYHWFNGKVMGEIEPMGGPGDGKIYPFKRIGFNQPVDANDQPIPVIWGKIFLEGDVPTAATLGLAGYAAMYSEELAAQTGIPPVPGAFDHYNDCSAVFSISHSITKENALQCADCHSTNSVLDFAALQYTPERANQLQTMDVPGGGDSGVHNWNLFER